MDLFTIFNVKTAETVLPLVATEEEVEHIQNVRLVTFAELTSTAPNGKKKQRPKKMHEDQLFLAFG